VDGCGRGRTTETTLLSRRAVSRPLFPHPPERSRFNRRRRQLAPGLNAIRQGVLAAVAVAQDRHCAIDNLLNGARRIVCPGAPDDTAATGSGRPQRVGRCVDHGAGPGGHDHPEEGGARACQQQGNEDRHAADEEREQAGRRRRGERPPDGAAARTRDRLLDLPKSRLAADLRAARTQRDAWERRYNDLVQAHLQCGVTIARLEARRPGAEER